MVRGSGTGSDGSGSKNKHTTMTAALQENDRVDFGGLYCVNGSLAEGTVVLPVHVHDFRWIGLAPNLASSCPLPDTVNLPTPQNRCCFPEPNVCPTTVMPPRPCDSGMVQRSPRGCAGIPGQPIAPAACPSSSLLRLSPLYQSKRPQFGHF
jgi:hypothetical protein